MEFGFRYPEGLEAKIEKAVAELGSDNFQTREEAQQRIVSIGHFAIPTLRRALRNDQPEVVRRSREALKSLEGKLGDGKPELRDYDTIETVEYTAKGHLEVESLKVRTKFFGDTTVKLTDIQYFRSFGSSTSGVFSVDATKYAKINQSEWMETSIEVTSGQQLEVTASGQVDQWPQTPGQYMAGPDGNEIGNGQRLGAAASFPGKLMGRIGANGTPFPIGASYNRKAVDNGKLYLRIGASPWNCESTGGYKVVVNLTNP